MCGGKVDRASNDAKPSQEVDTTAEELAALASLPTGAWGNPGFLGCMVARAGNLHCVSATGTLLMLRYMGE